MIQLYSLPHSSYSAKVRICLLAKGVPFEEVAPPGGYASNDYAKIVPASTIPAIDHGGFVLWDSEAITEYLEEAFPQPAMLPGDLRLRAFARSLSRFHDTRLEPNIRALFAHVAPQSRDTDKVAGSVSLIERRLQQLSVILERAPFLPGDRLLLSDCGFAISFPLLDSLGAAIGFETALADNVAAYRDRLSGHGVVADVAGPYQTAIAAWAKSLGA